MSNAHRAFRFGVQVSGVGDGRAWPDLARRVEGLGYSTITMPDHFDHQLAPVPALQSAADATSTLRLGALVHCNDYKHPVVLAKELATMDLLSGGRVEIGLGSGWMVSDYVHAGIPYDPPGVRVSRMMEGLAVIQGCMAPGPFSFRGEHYEIADYDGLPKPAQLPMPPVLIGGGGPHVLRFAAGHADIVGINPTLTSGVVDQSTFASMTAEAVDERVALVRRSAGDGGRLDHIETSIRVFMTIVTDDVDGSLDMVGQLSGASRDTVSRSPFVMIGPPSKMIDDLRQRRERWGFSYVIVGQDAIESFAPVVAALAGT